MRSKIAARLHAWADRLDHDSAVKVTSMTLTLEEGSGWTLRDDGKGMHVCYLGEDEYDKAHTEADNPPRRIDWQTMTIHPPGTSLR